MDSTNDGILSYEGSEDADINLVVKGQYTRLFRKSYWYDLKWQECYNNYCIRLAPKELMVWENE